MMTAHVFGQGRAAIGHLFFLLLFPLLTVFFQACSQYDTDVLGEGFTPLNGLVGSYTHLVYVEYDGGGRVRLWGTHANEVEWEADGARLTIRSRRDSMAYFVYGNALGDTLLPLNGQLRIESDRSFALYLNGLYLHSKRGPAVWCQTDEPVYLVLPAKSQNRLYSEQFETEYDADGYVTEADGTLFTRGPLTLDGTGSLTIVNSAPVRYATELLDSVASHAIYAMGGLSCAYAVNADLTSHYGDAIHVADADVQISDGTWRLTAGRHGICNLEGSVKLNGGTLYGTALGRFVSNPDGFLTYASTCIAASALPSAIGATQQFIWQERIDTLSLRTDSVLTITSTTTSTTTVGKLRPAFDIERPWLLLSTPTLAEADMIRIR